MRLLVRWTNICRSCEHFADPHRGADGVRHEQDEVAEDGHPGRRLPSCGGAEGELPAGIAPDVAVPRHDVVGSSPVALLVGQHPKLVAELR
jgi:hypothetical protein